MRTRPKGSAFVFDMQKEVGINPSDKIIKVGTWGDPNVKNIPGYTIVTEPQAGDIAAFSKQTSDGSSGHMGIMQDSKTLIYAGQKNVRATVIMNYSKWAKEKWVYRRYTGN